MSDLNANVVASLRAELAEFKAAANRTTESMGSEILRLQGELDFVTRHRDDLIAFNRRDCKIMAETGVRETLLRDAIPVLAKQRDEARAKLAAIRAPLQGVDVAKLAKLVDQLPELIQRERAAMLCEHFGEAAVARSNMVVINEAIRDAVPALLAAAREALANG